MVELGNAPRACFPFMTSASGFRTRCYSPSSQLIRFQRKEIRWECFHWRITTLYGTKTSHLATKVSHAKDFNNSNFFLFLPEESTPPRSRERRFVRLRLFTPNVKTHKVHIPTLIIPHCQNSRHHLIAIPLHPLPKIFLFIYSRWKLPFRPDYLVEATRWRF